jgi:Xaa-Pro aminopeptidase
MKKKAGRTCLLYAASETNADILYPTRFFAPDPFLFLLVRGRSVMVMSDLELDRARRQASVDTVLSWSKVARKVAARRKSPASAAAVIASVLADFRLSEVEVPHDFPLGLAMELDSLGVRLEAAPEPFWPERARKTGWEVRAVEASLRAAEGGLEAGLAALKACRIRRGFLFRDGRHFTVEDLRGVVNTAILQAGAVPAHTICAPGDQAVDPHEEGHGPLKAHTPIVMDIFPRSEKTGYYGDLTRTVVRGRAPHALHEVYALVHEGVRLGHRSIRPGVDGMSIHRDIQALFERQGYRTGLRAGRMQGFFHGTGHGLGLEIHERPSISSRTSILEQGHVVTVEPGLYYLGLGGVRIEDVALVTRSGSRNLTRVPKALEI